MRTPTTLVAAAVLTLSSAATATKAAPQPIKVEIQRISSAGTGRSIGTLVFIQQKQRLEIQPQVSGLTPGPHAMHIHEHGSCASSQVQGITIPGGAAGGQYHGAEDHQHHHHSSAHQQRPAGDLPELVVDAQGQATGLVFSDRLTLHEIKGRSIVIHAESEQSGGGARIACGVIL